MYLLLGHRYNLASSINRISQKDIEYLISNKYWIEVVEIKISLCM